MPCARTHSRGNCYCAMNISRAGVLYPDWLCTLPVTSSLYVANFLNRSILTFLTGNKTALCDTCGSRLNKLTN
ncbi:hypothetical protein F9C07_13195 [Aspergillus flavus]|uniref:Uncharacterized protein n=1 Tax=Aspergillus flavus (strain ATCC 200026 / FGSC A1120 / IAM 13836 / NRRL 3357 / JCM 12722 / SRRC 167) TaxID=332952 RepID=A0A7U2R2I9_ASPFN|nr:hypothetical protein F9C07_13195 [Aspergillus flavus]